MSWWLSIWFRHLYYNSNRKSWNLSQINVFLVCLLWVRLATNPFINQWFLIENYTWHKNLRETFFREIQIYPSLRRYIVKFSEIVFAIELYKTMDSILCSPYLAFLEHVYYFIKNRPILNGSEMYDIDREPLY